MVSRWLAYVHRYETLTHLNWRHDHPTNVLEIHIASRILPHSIILVSDDRPTLTDLTLQHRTNRCRFSTHTKRYFFFKKNVENRCAGWDTNDKTG